MMYDLRNSLFAAGVICVLLGVACVALTGTLPKPSRPMFGRLGATCLIVGVVCVIYAWMMAPTGSGYTGYAY